MSMRLRRLSVSFCSRRESATGVSCGAAANVVSIPTIVNELKCRATIRRVCYDRGALETMKLALHGYGKMGRTIERVAKECGHEVVCVFDVGRTEPLAGAEVLIDFSHASALDNALGIASDNKIPLVIGTTGWNERMDDVRRRVEAASIGCVHASNFSPGAN